MTKQLALDEPCPCCSGQPYGECCAPIVSGDLAAPTALALMRSRYTAYALGHIDHLKASLDTRWQASFDEQSTREWSEKAQWKGLVINGSKEGGPDDEEGEVEFTATFEMDGEEQQLRERAKFRKRGGLWRYIDGRVKSAQAPVVSQGPKVGRNDPCPCGSGKKHKKCCG